jgi:MFS family permease
VSEDPEGSGPEPARARAVGRAVRGLAVDIGPLRRHRKYRLLWFGGLISQTGRQITLVAVYFQVFQLTGSAAAVGLIGLVQVIPLIVFSIWGGTLVDRLDRRRLLLASQMGLVAATSILLAGAIAGDPPLWLVYTGTGLAAAFSGIDSPTGSAIIPNLISREELPSAIALNQVMFNTTMIAGPALAGLIIAGVGLSWAYAIDLATYGAAILAAWRLPSLPPQREPGDDAPRGWASVREGFSYLKGRRVLKSTFTIDLVAMIFGMPRALFPILAVTQFHRGPEVVGALFSAIAVGALAGALTAGWVGSVRHQGRAVMWAVAAWGAAIAAFGLVGDNLWLGLTLLALAGTADVISAVFRGTILQLSVPDSLRGRLSAIHILVVTGGPRLGDLEAGLVAQAFSPTISVISGGLACVVGVGVIALLVPELARYHVGEAT